MRDSITRINDYSITRQIPQPFPFHIELPLSAKYSHRQYLGPFTNRGHYLTSSPTVLRTIYRVSESTVPSHIIPKMSSQPTRRRLGIFSLEIYPMVLEMK